MCRPATGPRTRTAKDHQHPLVALSTKLVARRPMDFAQSTTYPDHLPIGEHWYSLRPFENHHGERNEHHSERWSTRVAHRRHSHINRATHVELHRCALLNHHRAAGTLRREHPASAVTGDPQATRSADERVRGDLFLVLCCSYVAPSTTHLAPGAKHFGLGASN